MSCLKSFFIDHVLFQIQDEIQEKLKYITLLTGVIFTLLIRGKMV